MNGYLPYVLGGAAALLPDMFEIFSAKQHKIIITYLLDTVTYNSAHTFPFSMKFSSNSLC